MPSLKKIISVVGARPNFMKVAPLHSEFKKHTDVVHHLICHTGQHYDEKMSKVFFEDLGLPKPDFYLGVGSGSHTEQTARTMIEFEKVITKERPDCIIVVGDVNSTIACSLVAVKMGIPVAHVEAGLRSFDRTMPEEINRILTDSIARYLFVTEQSGVDNLQQEGVAHDRVFLVGNVMIDSVARFLPKTEQSTIRQHLHLVDRQYLLATIHRPSNVDTQEGLEKIIRMFESIPGEMPVILPVHPRTRKNAESFGLLSRLTKRVTVTEPIGYIDFLTLIKHAHLVVTDSGGIQEETTYLGIPCITVRDNTERPSTVEIGTNILAGTDLTNVSEAIHAVLEGKRKKGSIPPLWDGKAAERIVKILIEMI